MAKRFVSVWFRFLKTDWVTLRQPALQQVPFVLSKPDHGRMIVAAVNEQAQVQGIETGMVVADARAVLPGLQVLDDTPGLEEKLLKRIAEWMIRFTPVVALDLPDGIVLDASGCTHLWGGDREYLTDIYERILGKGYNVRLSIADTACAAKAVARFANAGYIVAPGNHMQALLPLPPEALRLEPATVERLHKLGLHTIGQFIHMPLSSLRRRFGADCILKLHQALGYEDEPLQAVVPRAEYEERLPCLEPIATAVGIEIALKELLKKLCARLIKEQKGLRSLSFKGYRIDGETQDLPIQTNRPSHNVAHLFKLFEPGLSTIEPGLGIELFTLTANGVENHTPLQEQLWSIKGGLTDIRLAELIDRVAGRIGINQISRFFPEEHYWPERSFKKTVVLHAPVNSSWRNDLQRPIQLLTPPEFITVMAPVPDYPPMSFKHKNELHTIAKADGPERIEQEWWLQEGQHRDYYMVEDKEGRRYWIFRLGHYEDARNHQWFLHGYFA